MKLRHLLLPLLLWCTSAHAQFNGTSGIYALNHVLWGVMASPFSVATPGSGYATNDTVTLDCPNTSTFLGPNTVHPVVTWNGSAWSLTNPGVATSIPSTGLAGGLNGVCTLTQLSTSGTGSGVTFNATFGPNAASLNGSNTGGGGGGGTTPGGANGSIQYNNSGSFGGLANPLPIGNGGTGSASPSGVIAGTNVTVTGSYPNQTVNATGGGGGSLSITDGTHTVSPTTALTVNGATVSGSTPNASITISGGGTTTGFATHATLISSTTAFSTNTLTQAGYYSTGDGGQATYQWNATSYCGNGTSGSPVTADSISCILPSGQSPSTGGRYLLSLTDGAFNARQFGMQPSADLSFDNAPFVRPMMAAIGVQGQPNGPDIIFPVTAGQDYTLYYFTQPFELTHGVTLRCTTSGIGTGSFGNRVQFIFPPGMDGIQQENADWSFDRAGGDTSGISGCTVSSNGHFDTPVWGGAIDGTTTITGVAINPAVGLRNNPALPLIAAGDGLAILPGNSNFSGGGPAVHPGAYVTSVSGTAGNQTINLAQIANGAPRNYVLHQPPFVFGGLVTGVSMWDLPASEAYTVTISSISAPGVAQHAVITGGNRPLKPGDLIWSDPFVYGTLIYDPHNVVTSATVHSGGSGYTGTSGTMTWGGSIACDANPVLNVTASGGVITGVTSVATAGQCNAAFIPSTATGWVAGGGLSGGSGATFNTVYANTVEFETVTSWGYYSTALATGSFKLWKLGAGIMRRVGAGTRGSRSEHFPVGIELFCGPGGAGCSNSFDQNGSYDFSIIGRFATGTDGDPATSMGEEFNDNYTADIVDGSSLSSLYINDNSNSAETGTDIYPFIGLCDSLNHTIIVQGYMSINTYTDGSCLGKDVNGNFNIGVPPRTSNNLASQGSFLTIGDPYLVGNARIEGNGQMLGAWHLSGNSGMNFVTTAPTTSGTRVAIPSIPSTLFPGMTITDVTTPAAIPGGTTITEVDNAGVTMTNAVAGGGVLIGDTIFLNASLPGCLNTQGGIELSIQLQPLCNGDGLFTQYNGGVGAFDITNNTNGIPYGEFYVPGTAYTGYQGNEGIVVPRGIAVGNDSQGGLGAERLITTGAGTGLWQHPVEGNVQFYTTPNPGAPMGWMEVYTAIVQNTAPIVAGSTTTVAVTGCPSPTPTVGAPVTGSDYPNFGQDLPIGTFSSCSGTSLVLQAASASSIPITNVSLKFLETVQLPRIANDVNDTSWLPVGPTTIGGLVACGSTTVGLGIVTDGQTSGAAGYNAAVGTTGSTTRLVFCDGTSWTYH